jgi:hypothetical protein
MTLILITSKVKRTRWLIHSVDKYMKYMLHPSMCKSYLQNQKLEEGKLYYTYEEMERKIKKGKMQQKIENYELREEGILMFKDIIYVPYNQELKNMLLLEIHRGPYARRSRLPKYNCNCQKVILLAMYAKIGCAFHCQVSWMSKVQG